MDNAKPIQLVEIMQMVQVHVEKLMPVNVSKALVIAEMFVALQENALHQMQTA